MIISRNCLREYFHVLTLERLEYFESLSSFQVEKRQHIFLVENWPVARLPGCAIFSFGTIDKLCYLLAKYNGVNSLLGTD